MNQFLYDFLLAGADKWNQYRRFHPEVGMDPTKEDNETEAEWHQRIKTIVAIDFDVGDFQNLVLSRYNLSRAEFSNANCSNVCFDRCDLSNAGFDNAQLENCQFRSCSLWTALHGVNLRGTRFIDCDGVLTVNLQTSFVGVEVVGSRLKYLCFEHVQKDGIETEYSITEMTLQGETLVPTEAEVKIAEVRNID